MKKIVKSNNACNVKNINIEFIFARSNSAAHIARTNIIRQNVFIKKI